MLITYNMLACGTLCVRLCECVLDTMYPEETPTSVLTSYEDNSLMFVCFSISLFVCLIVSVLSYLT